MKKTTKTNYKSNKGYYETKDMVVITDWEKFKESRKFKKDFIQKGGKII